MIIYEQVKYDRQGTPWIGIFSSVIMRDHCTINAETGGLNVRLPRQEPRSDIPLSVIAGKICRRSNCKYNSAC